jgi:tRNA modification GTPase
MAGDVVEEEGIRRAKAEMLRADRVLYVLDASLADQTHPEQLSAELEMLPPDVPVTLIVNKIDLIGAAAVADETGPVPRIFVSARTGDGMDLIRAHLKMTAGYSDAESGALSARRRHLDALSRANDLVQSAADTLATLKASELFAEDLRLAQRALGEITGEFTNEDLLGEIFGSFCIGK